jgi:2-oxoglutarate dehydrogenase E2 component (dihydrolipoamide succinyltransferase)
LVINTGALREDKREPMS